MDVMRSIAASWVAVVEMCSRDVFLFWVIAISDGVIALSYFAIPIVLEIVRRKHLESILYPKIYVGFILFITGCGLTHATHLGMFMYGVDALGLMAPVYLFTALVSVATAIAFAMVLPSLLAWVSPSQREAELEAEVSRRVAEKELLLQELHHRVRNHLSVIMGAINVYAKKAESKDELANKMRLKVAELSCEYNQRKDDEALLLERLKILNRDGYLEL
jgi:hypothetical protein